MAIYSKLRLWLLAVRTRNWCGFL